MNNNHATICFPTLKNQCAKTKSQKINCFPMVSKFAQYSQRSISLARVS